MGDTVCKQKMIWEIIPLLELKHLAEHFESLRIKTKLRNKLVALQVKQLDVPTRVSKSQKTESLDKDIINAI